MTTSSELGCTVSITPLQNTKFDSYFQRSYVFIFTDLPTFDFKPWLSRAVERHKKPKQSSTASNSLAHVSSGSFGVWTGLAKLLETFFLVTLEPKSKCPLEGARRHRVVCQRHKRQPKTVSD